MAGIGRDDDKLPFAQRYILFADFSLELAFDHEQHLVAMRMSFGFVPRCLAGGEFHHGDLAAGGGVQHLKPCFKIVNAMRIHGASSHGMVEVRACTGQIIAECTRDDFGLRCCLGKPIHPIMSLSLNPEHLKRYKEVLALFFKYGHGDLVKNAPIIDDPLEHAPAPPVPPSARELAKDLEAMGPTFIKLGQLLSTRSDFIPPAYMEALSTLQDHVKPFPFEQVEAIVGVEVGARISKAFQTFDEVPIAAASLGQVHYAVLRSGQEVAVKVQRPNVREQVATDLAALAEVAEFLDRHTEIGKRFQFGKMVNELRKSMLRELDYRLEAQTMKLMREKLSQFDKLVIPAPIDDYSTGRVLTMQYVTGCKITKLHPVVRLEVDGAALAEEVFRSYLHQILVIGVFHADPHPGNVFLTGDGRIALLDFGMIARIGPDMQDQLLKLLLAISDGQSDRAATIAQSMGQERDGFDEVTFRHEISDLVSQQQGATVSQLEVGKVVMHVTEIAGRTGLSMPES